jgi:hypothetical protein
MFNLCRVLNFSWGAKFWNQFTFYLLSGRIVADDDVVDPKAVTGAMALRDSASGAGAGNGADATNPWDPVRSRPRPLTITRLSIGSLQLALHSPEIGVCVATVGMESLTGTLRIVASGVVQ